MTMCLSPLSATHLLGTVQRALEYRQTLQESHNYQQNLEKAVRARTEMLRQAMEDLEHSYDVTLEALGDALDLKDSETEGHSKRVTAYTIALARAMGISPATDQGDCARRLSARHRQNGDSRRDTAQARHVDFRKSWWSCATIARAATICCARSHFCAKRRRLSSPIRSTTTAAAIRPGCSSSEIPIGARIFAVADALDAITSDRPYRKARSFDEAREEILRCSGTQFDPEVVEVFLKISH